MPENANPTTEMSIELIAENILSFVEKNHL